MPFRATARAPDSPGTKLCTYCKENHPSDACPLVAKALAALHAVPRLKNTVFTSNPPAPFVGHYGYPQVNVGVLSPAGILPDSESFDDPRGWAAARMGINDLVVKRASLINSHQITSVKARSLVTSIAQEVAMAEKPAEVEVTLSKLPHSRLLSTDDHAAPTGPSAPLQTARIVGNVSIPRKIDSIVSDASIKAREAIQELYSKGFDENKIMRIMSVGLLGTKADRKIVPTKWAITATDDQISKDLLVQLRTYESVNEYSLYQGDYLGNYYFILVLPGSWSYELFELSLRSYTPGKGLPEASYDKEHFEGRKNYAGATAGGYYAVRLPVVEHLERIKRQATVVAFRIITNEYTMPLGVWVVREATRNAMSTKPMRFSDVKLLRAYLTDLIMKKFSLPIEYLFQKSAFVGTRALQKSLGAFTNS